MGLPFHPTHVHPQDQHNRRHGYADLLRYPQRYSDPLAPVERRHQPRHALGRSRLRPALRREHAPLRRRRLRRQRAAGDENGRARPRRRAVRPAQPRLSILRLGVRALLALLPALRQAGLQPRDPGRGLDARVRAPLRPRKLRPTSRGDCTWPAASCRGSSPIPTPTTSSPPRGAGSRKSGWTTCRPTPPRCPATPSSS